MQAELIVLGCGDSQGTPRIGNFWGNCDPLESKNIRTRPSVCVRTETTTIVVDTGPDFKQQINRENIEKIDAVLYTHAHSDHVNGTEDLKGFYDRTKTRTPIYATQDTLEEMKGRFGYIFEQKSALYPPIVDVNLITETDLGRTHRIGDIEFIPFVQEHGSIQTIGYRFGDVGYSTDLVDLNKFGQQALKGIKTWIIDGADLFLEKPLVHMSLKRLTELNEVVGAERIYLIHIKCNLDYQTLVDTLPSYIRPAYDGLKISLGLK